MGGSSGGDGLEIGGKVIDPVGDVVGVWGYSSPRPYYGDGCGCLCYMLFACVLAWACLLLLCFTTIFI